MVLGSNGTSKQTRCLYMATVKTLSSPLRELFLLFSGGSWADDSTTSYIAASLVQLVQQPVETYANKSFSIIEYSHSNSELTDILHRLHGKEPKLVVFDDEALNAQLNHENGYASLGAGILRKSGKGWWNYKGEEPIEVPGWKSVPVEEEIKKALSASA